MALYAELHRHLGGSVVPRILWRYLHRSESELAERFPEYDRFEAFYTQPRNTLDEYLELHTLVESVQSAQALPYFIRRLVRGAYTFENLAYLELRYTPYLRTDDRLTEPERIEQMREIVSIVGESSQLEDYPIITKQILCMHSRLPYAVNRAIVDLALEFPQYVCAVDLAGGDSHYNDRLDEFVSLYGYAVQRGIRTTGHVYETREGCYPELLPYLNRIGHGIQIPLQYPELLPELAQRHLCLEVCPTLTSKQEPSPIFVNCEPYSIGVLKQGLILPSAQITQGYTMSVYPLNTKTY